MDLVRASLTDRSIFGQAAPPVPLNSGSTVPVPRVDYLYRQIHPDS